MLEPHIQIAWTWTVRAFWTIGGFAGVTKIFEWFTNKPKIKGFWEADVVGNMHLLDGKIIGAHIMLLVDLVNVRMRPVSIRSWNLEIKTEKGEVYKAKKEPITPGFKLKLADGSFYPADFSKSILYQKTIDEPLVYGKTVRGWLRFTALNINPPDLDKNVTYILIGNDAFGKIHKIKIKRTYFSKTSSDPAYYPGAGMG